MSNAVALTANLKPESKYFLSKTINTSVLSDALARMHTTHAMAGMQGAGMLILGDPGLGKTTILNTYFDRYYAAHQDLASATVTLRPIIKVSIPSRPTIKGLITKILDTLGHPSTKGTQGQLELRLGAVIRNQGVQMLIFDEFQHLLREQADISTRHVVNFIKVMMDDYKLAVVMAGLEKALEAISQHEELYQRFTYEQVYLRPFQLSTEQGIKEFGRYLNSTQRILEDAGVDMVKLTSETMIQRLHLATRGVPRFITRLILRALEDNDLSRRITVDDFREVYGRLRLNRELGTTYNPFAGSSADKLREKSGWLNG